MAVDCLSYCSRGTGSHRSRGWTHCWAQIEVCINPPMTNGEQRLIQITSISSTSTSRSSQSPGSSGSTGSPTNPPSGLPSGPASSGLPYISPTSSAKESILHNTSMAAVSCGIGDRWVFLQDKDGLIRGAQFSASTSDWSVSSNAYSFQTASMGTTVAASCSNASAFGVGGPATVVSKAPFQLYSSRLHTNSVI